MSGIKDRKDQKDLAPLHIAHTEASLGWGGQEIRILTEMEGMRARGHRLTLLCPQEARIFSEAQARGLPVTALPIGRKRPAGVRALYHWFRTQAPDVINCHSSTDTWLTALACIGLRHPPPLVRTRHISAPVPRNAATRWLYRRATAHIVTTGEALRQTLVEDNGYDPASITSVPTGIDTKKFRPGDKAVARRSIRVAGNAFIVGIVATLRSWKGHEYLIQAFAKLPKDSLLLIVGDGPQRANIQALVEKMKLTQRVIMPGNQDDVRPWLYAMDVFVLPSYANEGVPQAVLQAMLCGLPVVATPVGGIPEAIKHGDTGLLVPARDVAALHRALKRLMQERELRNALSAAALAYAREYFGIERMLARMEAVFNSERRQ